MKMSVQTLTRIALLSALLYVSQVAMSFLPNVELVSFLILLYTLVFGRETFLTILVFNLFELVQWGFGTWWVSYLYVWPLLYLLVLLLKRLIREEFLVWSMVSGAFGLLFGSLFTLVYIPVDPRYALSYWISGLPWDVTHCISNFVIMVVLGKPLYQLLLRLNMRVYHN